MDHEQTPVYEKCRHLDDDATIIGALPGTFDNTVGAGQQSWRVVAHDRHDSTPTDPVFSRGLGEVHNDDITV